MAMSRNSVASKMSPHSSHSTYSASSSRETIRTRGCLQDSCIFVLCEWCKEGSCCGWCNASRIHVRWRCLAFLVNPKNGPDSVDSGTSRMACQVPFVNLWMDARDGDCPVQEMYEWER